MKRLPLLLGGCLLAFVVAEGLLRLLGVSYPVFFVRDPELGFCMRPGAAGWYRDEGRAFVQINSAGLRDREHSFDKPAGVYRIAVLGDSFCAAMQVPVEDAFWRIMETRLDAGDRLEDRHVEVVNFGVNGYGTAQELLMLRHRVWAYHPDLVLLAFFTGNDVADNLRELARDPLRPYFRLDQGKLVLDESFRNSIHGTTRSGMASRIYSMIDRSRVLQALHEAVRRLHPAPAGRLNDDSNLPMIYKPPTDPRWQAAWEVTERLLATIGREVRAHGARLVVVTLSNGIQVHPVDGTRERFRQDNAIDDLFYPDHRVAEIGHRNGFPVICLAPSMQREAAARGTFLHGFEGATAGDGHWNRAGHRLAGELLAERLPQEVSIAAH